MCGVLSNVGTAAITMPMTAIKKKRAGSSRRARPAQKRRRRMVPDSPHSFTSNEVMRNPESTKKASTP